MILNEMIAKVRERVENNANLKELIDNSKSSTISITDLKEFTEKYKVSKTDNSAILKAVIEKYKLSKPDNINLKEFIEKYRSAQENKDLKKT